MNTELLLLLYREMYDEQLVRSDGLGAGVLLPVGGILVLVTGGMLYQVYNLLWMTDWRWHAAIVVALLLAIGSTIIAVCYLLRAQRDSRSKYLPNPQEIERHRKELTERYEKDPTAGPGLANDIDAFLVQTFSQCVVTNTERDDRTWQHLRRALTLVAVAAGASVAAMLLAMITS
ncbi:MAG: hypothetical protein PVJ64_07730 [Gemmatimonadales bacterium]|jgi:hypothetical protein